MTGKKAIVMGRNYTSRLGMIRAAGEAGCDVAVIKTERASGKKIEKIDASSRYVSDYDCCPQPDEAGLISLLNQKYANPDNKPVLLPTDDYSASVIDTHLTELRDGFDMPNIGGRPGAVAEAMDKMRQKEIASRTGLEVGMGWRAEYRDGEYLIPQGVTFPCFIKPEVSVRGSKYQMRKCVSEQELRDALKKIGEKSTADIMIEEFIPVEKELAVLGVCTPDACVIPAVLETELSYMGVTGIGKAVPIAAYAGLESGLKDFIRAFGFTGLFDIDLFAARDRVYFNELNLRYGANGYAVSHGVCNLPGLFIGSFSSPLNEVGPTADFMPFAFLNEKVCHQLCTDAQMTWKEFFSKVDEAEVTLVKSDTDPRPYRYFLRKVFLSRLKHLFK